MSDDQGDRIQATDRRTSQADENPSANGADGKDEAGAQAYSEASERCASKDKRSLPPIDFSTFVLSLSQAVLLHLGELEDPDSGTCEQNLAMARQSIDLLGMIQEKTRGNLDEEEQKLIENLLYDLRMKYVAGCKGS